LFACVNKGTVQGTATLMRKVLDLDDEMLQALKHFAAESDRTIDELAHEAFALLLKKYCRPKSLKEALEMSLRRFAGNDNPLPRSEQSAR
jgi:hypothetical protein